MVHAGIAIDDPGNARVLAYLTRRPSREERQAAIATLVRLQETSGSEVMAKSIQRLADEAPDPPRLLSQSPDGVDLMTLGALPEIVERLWKLGRELPADCRWVAYRHAVLAHPVSGIIFGLALGTLGIVLRLPGAEAGPAVAAGAVQSLTYKAGRGTKTLSMLDYGPDWWFFGLGHGEASDKFVRAAYEHFGAA